MTQYKFKAMDQTGRIRTGSLHATNIFDVEHQLNTQQYDLISCKEVVARNLRFLDRKLTRRDLINMVFQLEQLTRSGVSLLEGLKDLRDSTPASYFKDVLSGIVESIEGGKTFSEALENFPQDFDDVFRSLIEVGEESGELPKILNDMGNSMKWIDEIVAATTKVAMYPAIVGTIILGVAAFLMIYLVPKIIPFVEEMGGDIPGHTQALIAVSNFFIAYWWLLLSAPIVTTVVLKSLAKSRPKIRYKLDKLKLNMPIFGNIMFKLKLARLANYMALMYASGITVLRSIDISKSLVNSVVISEALEDVHRNISDGKSISQSFSQAELFPPLVVRMVRVGENTGNLDDALNNVSYFYNREVKEAIDKLEPAISPLLTVVMGSLLGWIMLSVLGPVWDAVSKIG